MEKIIIKKQTVGKRRRAAVVVKPETYMKISKISYETNQPVETIVDMLLTEALKYVEVEEV